MDRHELWNRYCTHVCRSDEIGLTVDISRMTFEDGFFDAMRPKIDAAYQAMDALEAGAIANPDEDRMVGHYWLRDAGRAPSADLKQSIAQTVDRIRRFAGDVHLAKIRPEHGDRFTDLLVIGIGGSALGPQFVADALGIPGRDKMVVHFFDNTDPDGMARTMMTLASSLDSTLALVISKSGSTPETRNGLLVAKAAYEAAGLDFGRHAVAVTGEGSKLDQVATEDGWIERFPMWDWVGGRTSETSAVGLLPAALQGLDIDAMLRGAADCDAVTRTHDTPHNPAALLALMWHHATGGRGRKDMVILPYRDRLLLFSRYLQQLVMESLGKEEDLEGNVVHQGIAVYGNKGSTDQHAYVQQLREGVNNFFVTFIEVLEVGDDPVEVEPGVTSGDFLRGFLMGTREALYENGRESITITVPRLDAYTIGVLIALYERAVGFYASLVGINAYQQPGVEAGKKAAAAVLDLQAKAVAAVRNAGRALTADEIAASIGQPDRAEAIHHILKGLAANRRGITHERSASPAWARFAVG